MQWKLKEIYLREPGDINYREGILEHDNVLETYIQKIKMILNTNPGEVLGFPNFGAGLNELVFEMNANVEEIRKRIYEQITQYCQESPHFKTDIDISFFKGTTRDAILIDITINGNKEFGVLLK